MILSYTTLENLIINKPLNEDINERIQAINLNFLKNKNIKNIYVKEKYKNLEETIQKISNSINKRYSQTFDRYYNFRSTIDEINISYHAYLEREGNRFDNWLKIKTSQTIHDPQYLKNQKILLTYSSNY